MKTRKKSFSYFLIVCVALICVSALLTACRKRGEEEAGDSDSAFVTEAPSATAQDSSAVSLPDKEYNSLIDFESLREENPDIYAWLDIPGTDVSFPVVNRAGDNSFYLTHGSDGKKAAKGAIFTEDYNSLDFGDPVTVIYGHRMNGGDMFGSLEKNYSNREFFYAHRELVIYMPDSEKHYTIFAAVPYGNEHLLYYFNFSKRLVFEAFFENILSIRSLSAVTDRDFAPEVGQRVVVLSTCLAGNNQKRYLVFASENRE